MFEGAASLIRPTNCTLAICLAAFLATGAAEARQTTDHYRVSLLGIPVGNLQLTQTWSGRSYASRSDFGTSGIVAVVKNVGFVMESKGARSGSALDPSFYAENVNTGERTSEGTFSFPSGDVRWDPNSAMMQVFTDRPAAEGCALSTTIFDGKRSHLLDIREGEQQGEKFVCQGTLMRSGGYSAAQLEQRAGYTFAIVYDLKDDMLAFDSATVNTHYGKATVTRR
ncbi:DUF3108 domain-containing protein [Maritimibacter sp. DP1N21-5]|uniref:DUF3108 domain-containing protein n=1 Tax=Maritimibacter sp. DP1N21-5 TaxID=2836867 RepID=UPI001C455623|nr:DUF3108 domain-containing protein [Maritimibacter sp. DP1N21-5]MBV7409073.1 DUF3108 domain-containing protein [Maritimibacter sp. DP1N21-5]